MLNKNSCKKLLAGGLLSIVITSCGTDTVHQDSSEVAQNKALYQTNERSMLASQSSTVQVYIQQTSSWGTGYQVQYTLLNQGATISNWLLEFDMSTEITSIWDAIKSSKVGTHYQIIGPSWNVDLPGPGSTSFGFIASGTYAAPTGCKINGVACTFVTGVAPSPSPLPTTTTTPSPIPTTTTTPVTPGVPAKPALYVQADKDWSTGKYSVKVDWNIWWGNNASSWKILENSVVVGSGNLVENSPNPQSASITLTGRNPGTYRYDVIVTNKLGQAQETQTVAFGIVGPTPTPTATVTPTPSPTPTVTPTPTPTTTTTPTPIGSQKLYVGYFQSWSEQWQSDGSKTGLAKLPPYVNVVNLSFMKPDGVYNGNLDLSGTGLDYTPGGPALKQAISTLKSRNPNTKVMIAVGGATYTQWATMNTSAIQRLVKDFGFDGVDIDYEPTSAGCTWAYSGTKCASDAEFISVIQKIRTALPRPYIVSVAAWSIGAYGTGDFASAQPQGDYTGVMINPLRSVGSQLDLINVMSYDASNVYQPKQALLAYQSLYSGNIVLGVEVPPEAWGGHITSIAEVTDLTNFVVQKNAAGMMIWSLQKQPNGAPSSTNPSALMISQTVCQILKLPSCDLPLF